jgi:4-aminobutyrate aminotransferase-like enzyme
MKTQTQTLLETSRSCEPECMNWQAPVVWDHGLGAELWDVEGRSYIDWTSGVLVANVGHAHPRLAEAISRQAGRLLNTYDFPTPERLALSSRLITLTPPQLDKVFFLSTGSEATDAAIRIVKRHSGKFEILAFWGGFHGRSYGPMSVCGNMNIKRAFGPMVPGAVFAPYAYCYRCPFDKVHPDCDLFCLGFLDHVLAAQSTGNLGSLIVEPYQGAAGFVFPPPGYLKSLETWAKERDILVILDEIQSSFGRTGKMWAMEHENLQPDLLCLGKGIGSGVPIAALLARSEIMESLGNGEMSSTAGGNPLSCAGALAVLDIIETENLVSRAAVNGAHLGERLHGLMKKYPII